MLGLAIAAAGAAGALAAGYQSMAPTGQWYGSTFTGLSRPSKWLALTYDDGPNDPWTLRLLDVLNKYDVRATFFLIGRYAQQRPDIVRRLAQAGHVIGNHTFTHPLLIFRSGTQVKQELESCEKALSGAVGDHSNLFRPPFGGRRPVVLCAARRLGLQPVMWDVTGYDWNAPSAEYIEARVTRRVRGGNVILLHDGGHLRMGADRSRTVTATDRLIARYQSEGYRFVTIPQMMAQPASSLVPPAIP
jgi:peptidoglycan/xylan/chitin deacetylase (PgdA/CDA1 family)